MKILCETQVLNRQNQQHRLPKAVKATIAVGYSSKGKDANDNKKKLLEIMHFTPQNKSGTRYKIHDNVQKVFTRFVQDGKATISFRMPPEDLMIRCDPIQLKTFLQTLKLGIEGKSTTHLMGNILSATAIPQKSHPQLKMAILKRSDYPTKGFPKSLTTLKISNIELMKVTFEVCSLRNLTFLDLSNNKISKIPSEIGRLCLTECHLNDNLLGDTNAWQWLEGNNLRNSLRELDLSENNMKYFPRQLVKLEKLVSLKLNNNSLTIIPFAVRRLRCLRYLHLSSNQLESLPSAFNRMRLELLDVWGNNFLPRSEENQINSNTMPPPTVNKLWLLAARVVHKSKLHFTAETLPWDILEFLTEAPECSCGKLCYNHGIIRRSALATFDDVKNLIFCRDRHIYADFILCGPTCSARKYAS